MNGHWGGCSEVSGVIKCKDFLRPFTKSDNVLFCEELKSLCDKNGKGLVVPVSEENLSESGRRSRI